MTVAELIEQLRQFPEAMPVAVWDMGYGGLNPKVFVERDTNDEDDEVFEVVAIGGLSEQEVSSGEQ